jgi:hypothetical protein
MVKTCLRCKQEKDLNLFYKNKNKLDGKASYCQECLLKYSAEYRQNNRQKTRESSARYRAENLEKVRTDDRRRHNENKERQVSWTLKSVYGITLEEYNDILVKQNNVCAICNKPEKCLDYRTGTVKRLSVDHCHTTDKIRGLLCSGCNRGIGYLKEDFTIFEAATRYLKKHMETA